MTACMGGWCPLRDRCAHYVDGDRLRNPAERLCLAGDADQFVPLTRRFVRIEEAR